MNAEKKAAKETALEHGLHQAVAGIKQGPSRRTVVLLCAAAVLLVGFLFRLFWLSSEAAASGRWLRLDEAVFADQLTALADDAEFKDSPQGRFARFQEARVALNQGLSNLGSSPELGIKDVRKATDLYEDLARSAGRVPLLRQEALSGAAKGNEALGDVEKARAFYERLVREYPTSALGKDAAKDLTRLEKDASEVRELAKLLAPSK